MISTVSVRPAAGNCKNAAISSTAIDGTTETRLSASKMDIGRGIGASCMNTIRKGAARMSDPLSLRAWDGTIGSATKRCDLFYSTFVRNQYLFPKVAAALRGAQGNKQTPDGVDPLHQPSSGLQGSRGRTRYSEVSSAGLALNQRLRPVTIVTG